MVGEIPITVCGALTDDPELRFTPSGAAVANFTVASNARKFNKQTQEWEDQEATFLRCSVWRQEAENVAESLTKGSRVVVTGFLKTRGYEDRDGNKRTSWECDVIEIGASLKFATAKITRTSRGGGGQSDSGRPGSSAPPPQDDPWGRSGGGQGGGSQAPDPWGAPSSGDEPPF